MSWLDDMNKDMDQHPEWFGMVLDEEMNPVEPPNLSKKIAKAKKQLDDIYISYAKPPITHDWCRLCKSANQVAGQPIEHWYKCALAIIQEL